MLTPSSDCKAQSPSALFAKKKTVNTGKLALKNKETEELINTMVCTVTFYLQYIKKFLECILYLYYLMSRF